MGPNEEFDPVDMPDPDENYDPRDVRKRPVILDEGDAPPAPADEDPFKDVPESLVGKDLREAAKALDRGQARYAVNMYYTVQGYRIATNNQAIALMKEGAPNTAIKWMQGRMQGFEREVQVLLNAFTKTEPSGMGVWARSILGIGPVISAALLAYIDIEKAPTVGHIWRFAGLDPTIEWLGTERAAKLVREVVGDGPVTADHLVRLSELTARKLEVLKKLATTDAGNYSSAQLAKGLARRPWSSDLKVVCWKAGESFVKVCNNPRDIYGHVIVERKAYENRKNEALEYAKQADYKLSRYNIGKETEAYKWYSKGMLPPAHIHARCKRYAVKLFLAHYWEVAFRRHFKTEPPRPYPIAQGGHAHYIAPPNV